jgi:hypothetical protein
LHHIPEGMQPSGLAFWIFCGVLSAGMYVSGVRILPSDFFQAFTVRPPMMDWTHRHWPCIVTATRTPFAYDDTAVPGLARHLKPISGLMTSRANMRDMLQTTKSLDFVTLFNPGIDDLDAAILKVFRITHGQARPG